MRKGNYYRPTIRRKHLSDFHPKFTFNRENNPQLNELDFSGEISSKNGKINSVLELPYFNVFF